MNRRNSGFSLVELLTVMAVLSLLIVGVGQIGSNLVGGRDLSGTVRSCESLVAQTRQAAIQSGGRARLLVSTDGAKPYQQVCIVQEARDSDGKLYSTASASPRFERASRVFNMRSGVFFLPELSTYTRTMQFDPSVTTPQTGSTGTSYIYLEFDSQGNLVDPAGRFLVGRGELTGGSPTRRPGPANIDGFFISKLGKAVSLDTASIP